MKLTILLMIVTCLHVAARGVSQTVTYSAKEVPVEQVLMALKKLTGLKVFYTQSMLERTTPVTITANAMPIEEFLDQLLKDQPVTYRIKENVVILSAEKRREATLVIPDAFKPPVTGIVRGPDGQPLSGVNIIIKGTKRGVVSNADGNFTIDAKEGDILILSSVGFTEQRITVGSGRMVGTISLAVSNSPLDEVQIIAYGQTTPRLNTGNAVTIKSEEIEKQPVNNPLLALQARVPGLIVTPTTGLAGGAVNLQIRGNNSLNFVSSPLIVVDGLPILNNIPGLGHFNLTTLSSLGFLNPNDIEAISVLKDADATSIYGSRGSNGVILITTKKGSKGLVKLNINAQTGFADVSRKVKLLNTADYIEMRKEAYSNDNRAIAEVNAPDLLLWDQNRYTDWQEELIGNTAKYSDIQLSLSGGNNNLQYRAGANYHKETTVFPDNKSDQKWNAHLSINSISPNQKIQTSFNINYLIDRNTLPGIDFTNDALRLAPNAPAIFNADGSLNWEPLTSGTESWKNPYSELQRAYYGWINNLIASGKFAYRIIPSLTFKTQMGYNYLIGKSSRLTPLTSLPFGTGLTTNSSFNETEVQNISVEPQLEFRHQLGPGSVNFLVGASLQNTKTSNQLITALGFTDDAFLENLSAAESYILFNDSRQYKYAAIFGRLNYNLRNKYILNLTARRDGSSRFGPGRQFGNFGSVGAAWLFAEENFIKSSLNFISSGKLRASYGTSGNDGIDDYAYLERYEIINFVDPYQGGKGYRTLGIFNDYYGWETTRKLEIGLEAGFFKDRVLLGVSAYRNRSNDQLILSPYPSTAGPGSAYINYPGLVENTGIEATLSTEIIQAKSFSWSAAINFTKYSNKLISFPDFENSFYYGSYEIGKPFFGYAWTYKAAGVNPESGLYEFGLKNGDLVPDPEDVTELDGGRYMRIRTIPEYYGGISNTIKIRNITLDLFVQFTKQNGVSHLAPYYSIAGARVNLPEEFVSRWQKAGDETEIQKLSTRGTTPAGRSGVLQQQSDEYFTNASFARLKNISISYDFSKTLLNKIGVDNLKLFLHGQNLFTITPYKGLDPETQSMGSLPPLRVITIGINTTF